MTDDWPRDMDRRLQAMRDNPEGYVAKARRNQSDAIKPQHLWQAPAIAGALAAFTINYASDQRWGWAATFALAALTNAAVAYDDQRILRRHLKEQS